jgi:NADH-quinone oxidoreductase subunit N
MPTVDYVALAPELILVAVLSAALLIDLILPEERKWLLMPVSFAGVVVTLAAVLNLVRGPERETLGGMFVVDSFAVLFKIVFCLAALLVFAMSHEYLKGDRIGQGEYYFLILCSLLGMLAIASSRDLIAIFVALETITIPAFILAGIRKSDLRSNEASLKFFLFGVLSSALMLYGMSLIYGITGTTNLEGIAQVLTQPGELPGLPVGPPAASDFPGMAVLSIFFIIVGFGFKVSAFPFQWWVPDTYEGSPVPVAAFLSVASKTAGFVGLLQIMFLAFQGMADVWRPFLGLVAAFTMTFGNLVALQQKHIIRLLAYSSIGQAGYILLPLGIVQADNPSVNQEAFAAAIVYLLIYAFMETGAFAAAAAYGKRGGGYFISDYAGLFRRSPGLAFAMSAFLLSLAGLPPLAGWAAKFFVFKAVINGGAGVLAAVMAVNTVIALFYYAGVVGQMAFRPPPEEAPSIEMPPLFQTAIAVPAVVVLVVGILPDLFGRIAGVSTLV